MRRGVVISHNAPVSGLRIALSALVLLLSAGSAEAYPEFQFSQDAPRCSLCHYSPTGGGLINNYGRSQAEDSISTFGGNPDFLYGVWKEPKWVHFGFDLRGAFLTRKNGAETETAAFPMQGDTYTYFFFGDFTIGTIFGPRAAVRTPRQSVALRMNSREHWIMWRKKSTGPYLRAGRYFAPFGLRQQDHTVFNRRYLGFHSYEETYNLTGGYVKNDWEVHMTAFMPPPGPLYKVWGGGPKQTGLAAYYERRILDREGAVGGQFKLAITPLDTRTIAGGVAKYYVQAAKLELMGEIDLGVQDFDAVGLPSRRQLTGYAEASWFPIKGIMASAAIERHDPDLSIAEDGYDATQLTLQWFATSHIEVETFGRLEFSGDYQKPRPLYFLMLHYWM